MFPEVVLRLQEAWGRLCLQEECKLAARPPPPPPRGGAAGEGQAPARGWALLSFSPTPPRGKARTASLS